MKVRTGWEHCLALSDAGKVYYWGNQYHARNRREDICKVPRVLDFPRCSIQEISCGFDHSLALGCSEFNLSHNHVFTWGCNDHGQLGYAIEGSVQLQPAEVREVGEGLVGAGAGRQYTAVLRSNGEVLGWGHLPCPSSNPALPTVVYRASTAALKSSGLICGVEQIWLMREADYSYSVATMLDSPEEAMPRHQRAVSHEVAQLEREA